jgi:hypothetical protein
MPLAPFAGPGRRAARIDPESQETCRWWSFRAGRGVPECSELPAIFRAGGFRHERHFRS